MDSFSAALREHVTRLAQADGAGLVTALVLIVLLTFFTTRHRWSQLRGSVVLFGLHLLCLGAAELFERNSPPARVLDLLALFFLLSCIGRTLFLLLTRSVISEPLLGTLPKIFLDIVHFLIFIVALLFTLRAAGVEPASLLTGSALLTAVIGLSLRDTLGNLFAGLAIQAQRPFELGDWIQFDQIPGHIGQVIEINWRATKVVTLDAVEIIIPNATLGQGHIVNFTKPRKFSRRSLYIHAPYDVPPQRVQQIILDALEGAWGVLTDPPPSVVTHGFDERGVQYWVRLFTVEFDKRDKVDGGARDRIWYALHRHGIAIPAPQREILLEEAGDETAATREQERLTARRMNALRCVDFFAPLGEDCLGRLAGLARTRLYGDGETVIRQGTPGEELFIIQQGEVAILLDRAGSNPVEVARLGPRSFFGEMSLLTGEPRTATVRATRPCELLVVDKLAFAQMLDSFPELLERITEVIANRQAGLTSKRDEAIAADGHEEHERGARVLLKRIREFFNV
jgi:small-conductance mechanosensitive channel/CRP-like cAMP-binding protein